MFAEALRSCWPEAASLSAAQVSALERHYEMLVRWNAVLNLTAIRDLNEAVERHYCESLFLAAQLPPGPSRIADLGSGAGFPGYPLAVARPECEVTLIESHQRKAVFLREASRGTANMRVLSRRAEDVGETFDWVVSRAVDVSRMAKVLARLATRVAVLSGEQAPALHVVWGAPIRLPWGERRFLWMGELAGVSRETGKSVD